MTARIDVAGPIQRHLDHALDRLEDLRVDLLPEAERFEAMAARAQAKAEAELQANPGYALGQMQRGLEEMVRSFAEAFRAGYEAR